MSSERRDAPEEPEDDQGERPLRERYDWLGLAQVVIMLAALVFFLLWR